MESAGLLRIAVHTRHHRIEHTNELPPDPPRLRAILAYLDQRILETETVATYLRLQTTAVRQALAAAEKQPCEARRLPPQPRPALQAPARQAGGFVVEKQLHAGHPLGPV